MGRRSVALITAAALAMGSSGCIFTASVLGSSFEHKKDAAIIIGTSAGIEAAALGVIALGNACSSSFPCLPIFVVDAVVGGLFYTLFHKREHKAPPGPVTPPAPEPERTPDQIACSWAGDSIGQLMVPPDVTSKSGDSDLVVRSDMSERVSTECLISAWTPEVRECLRNIASDEAESRCFDMMTPEQQERLTQIFNDVAAKYGGE